MTTANIFAVYDRLTAEFEPDSESLSDAPRRFLLIEASTTDDTTFFSDHATLDELTEYVRTEHDATDWQITHVFDLERDASIGFLVETAIKFPA